MVGQGEGLSPYNILRKSRDISIFVGNNVCSIDFPAPGGKQCQNYLRSTLGISGSAAKSPEVFHGPQ